MNGVEGDIAHYTNKPGHLVLIPTNCEPGIRAIMGGGVAALFADLYPTLPMKLGRELSTRKRSQRIEPIFLESLSMNPLQSANPGQLWAFPTKVLVAEDSDLSLIAYGIGFMQAVKNERKRMGIPTTIVSTRAGCGLGGLDWDTQVGPMMDRLTDDEWLVVFPPEKHRAR
jgi:hypothetical protein